MSLVIMNDPTKVEDQARISREHGQRIGWGIAGDCGYPDRDGVYSDNNRSAWKKNRRRPAWDQMLADIKAGRINAVIVYHGDRLIRQPRDLEDLIDLADGKGVRLAAPTGMRDLDNTDDRFVLRILVAQACMESDNTSRRRKNQYERWRREGRVRPGGRGGRAFGFATDGVTHLPPETAVVREAARRVLEGEPAGAICRDLESRGVMTPTGIPFQHGTLRKMLARPRYAGLMPDGEQQAAWQPVLERETWETVRAILSAKAAGFTYATNARRWLLSGIARCGACGEPVVIKTENRPGKPTGYRCARPGCRKVQRSAALLDEYVITRVIARLGHRGNPPGRVPRNTAAAGEFRALAIQRAEVEGLLVDHTKGSSARLLLRRLESIDARLAQLREQSAGSAQSRLLSRHASLTREEFDALPLATRRALVAALFTITVLPASKRGPGFRTEDVSLIPTTGSGAAG
jgi:site-specific DNA recombinase